jgi:hypothetical protein
VIDTVAAARAEAFRRIDTESARLETLLGEKRAALDADSRLHPLDQNVDLQRVLEKEVTALQKKRANLRDERFSIEINGLPPEKTASRSEPKEWPIDGNLPPAPEYPKGARQRGDHDLVEKRFGEVLDLHSKATMHGLRDAGVTPTGKVTYELLAWVIGEIRGYMVWSAGRFSEAEDRIADLEIAPVRYRGVWQRSDEYRRGHVVTDSGSAWHAVRDVPAGEKPGSSDFWQLMVKAGKDARP